MKKVVLNYLIILLSTIILASCIKDDEGGSNEGGGSDTNCAAIQYNYNTAKKNREDAQRLYNQYLGTTYAASYANVVSNYNAIMAKYQQMAREKGCSLSL